MNPIIQSIRKKLYLAMDGANSSSMRKKGLEYKLNFGVPIMTLRNMAKPYAFDPELANQLWQEDTRELKILATLIQDPGTFQDADEWIQQINNPELAEQVCMNLFSKMPDAGNYALQWVQSPDLYPKMSGYLLYGRLFMGNHQLSPEEKTIVGDSLSQTLTGDSLLLKNTALTALQKWGNQSNIDIEDIINPLMTGKIKNIFQFQ